MSIQKNVLKIFLIRMDIFSKKDGLKRTNQYITSSRLCTTGNVSDAAIFRSRESAEKGIRKILRHSEEYGINVRKQKRFYVEEHEIQIDDSEYVPF